MKINSYYPVLCVGDVYEGAEFYKTYFGFKTIYESDWYIHLQMENDENINIAFVSATHNTVPEAYRKTAEGVILNFEMEDVDDLYERLQNAKLNIPLELRDEPWGQRHFIVTDPCGAMIDVIKLIEPSKEYQDQYVA